MHRSWVIELRFPIWTNKLSLYACVFWRVHAKDARSQYQYLRACGDTSFFANRRTHAVVALDEFRYQRHTRRKKFTAFSPFFFHAVTSPASRRFREVVLFSAVQRKCPLSRALISIRACGSSGLNYRYAYVCHVSTCARMCVCVYVMRFFCFHSRTCPRTSEFRAAKHHLVSFYKYIIFLSSRDFIFSLSLTPKNTR